MGVLLAVRFLAELGMLACLGVGGWQLGTSLLTSLGYAVALPAAAAFVWGRWIAPRAPRRLEDPMRLGVEVSLFTAAILMVGRAEPAPTMALVGVATLAAFLVSIPARKHEPMPPAASS